MTPSHRASPRRRRSRQHLLEVIRREGGVTRADLKLLTGLSRSAVAEAVQDLLDERLISEDVLAPGGKGSGRGRPSALLVATPRGGLVLALDFGHEHVAVAVADTTGKVLAQQRLEVSVDENPEATLDAAAGTSTRLLGRLGRSLEHVRAGAAGIPAPLDVDTNQVRPDSVMGAWASIDIAAELSSRFNAPVAVANDASMGAIGERRFGAARGMRDFVYVKASEGIGAALVLGGAVHKGSFGLAGEIGHLRYADEGQWFRCGTRGCLETVLSSALVERRVRDARLPSPDPVHPLRDCADDPVVSAFVTEAGRTLGRVLADLCTWINPTGIVLGGVLGSAGAPMVEGVRQSVDRFTPTIATQSLEIKAAQLGLRSELLGCVAAAIQEALFIGEEEVVA
jgi:predicted NBD/HSP70 family sugar kinase